MKTNIFKNIKDFNVNLAAEDDYYDVSFTSSLPFANSIICSIRMICKNSMAEVYISDDKKYIKLYYHKTNVAGINMFSVWFKRNKIKLSSPEIVPPYFTKLNKVIALCGETYAIKCSKFRIIQDMYKSWDLLKKFKMI